MKNIILAAITLLFAGALQAHHVDPATARKVAQTFLAQRGIDIHGELQDMTARTPFTEMYLFSTGGNDFVLVSADDCVAPILGYSTASPFVTAHMPAHISDWLAGYEAQIRTARERQLRWNSRHCQNSQQAAVAAQWKQLSAGTAPQPPLASSVSALMTTKWDQAPYYNNLCPQDYSESYYYGYRTVAGCVATATAQVMKYHNHPDTGYSSHSYTHSKYGTLSADFGSTAYDWTHMPNKLSGSSSATQKTAVATLIYHIGVADEMNYNTSYSGGSSANNYNYLGTLQASSQTSLMRYFRYSPMLYSANRGDMPAAEWNALLQAELDAGRPILFSGRSASAGHSFVVDGYNSAGQFHINWGWGGSNDGYFTMGALDPSGSGIGGNDESSYNLDNVALLGITPDTSWGQMGTVTVTYDGSGEVSGGGTYGLGDEVSVYAKAETGHRFKGWSDGGRYNPRNLVYNGGNLAFHATFEPLPSDTITYATGGYITGLGGSSSDFTWGMKFPSASIESGTMLRAVEFYACAEGTYDVTVYGGNASPTTPLFRDTLSVASSQTRRWHTFTLDTPIELSGYKRFWLVMHTSDATYPAAMTYGTGNTDGLLWTDNLTWGGWKQFSFMVRGIAYADNIASGDTLSYCGQREYNDSWEFNDHAFSWGIMLPADRLEGRNQMESVMIYADYPALLTMKVYQGGADAPQTLLFQHDTTVSTQGWHTLPLHHRYVDTLQNLWIVFTAPGNTQWPAAACRYTGHPNSNWLLAGNGWEHAADPDGVPLSWMIRTVMHHVERPSYTLTVATADSTMGTATGGGTFLDGESADIKATSLPGHRFVAWSDGSPDSVRTLTVVCDTHLTAHFEPLTSGIGQAEGQQALVWPNPTSRLLHISAAGCNRLRLTDPMGRTILSAETTAGTAVLDLSGLPAGIYYLRIGGQAMKVIRN